MNTAIPQVARSYIPIADLAATKRRLRRWAARFPFAQILDNCSSTTDRYGSYELIVGVGGVETGVSRWEDARLLMGKEWLMGGLPYDLRNRFEPTLKSLNPKHIEVPEVMLFRPRTTILLTKGSKALEVNGPDLGLRKALSTPDFSIPNLQAPVFVSNFSKEAYIQTVQALREHIAAGDCYEINLSQVFSTHTTLENPALVFEKLLEISPVPFAAMLKYRDHWTLCASPERFLQKQGAIIRTQPIKGTAARGLDYIEDQQQIHGLSSSIKERAENVMIVDLSRNDLYRVSETNSVTVPHLFEIQTFPTVHQMVSTIEGELRDDIDIPAIIEQIFPAGSMTGAPKVKTMELIDRYEPNARGLYAGSIGYFSPEGDFDLNVVIRALQYDACTDYLEYQVGGAITYDSDPEAEYQETLVKAEAIRRIWE